MTAHARARASTGSGVRGSGPLGDTDECRVERERPRPRDAEPDQQRDVQELDEPEEIAERRHVLALRGHDRDDHDDDQRHAREPRAEAGEHKGAAHELGRRRERRLQLGVGDAELAEELDDLVEVVELPPAGPEEDPADGEACEGRRQPCERPGDLEHEPADARRRVTIDSMT